MLPTMLELGNGGVEAFFQCWTGEGRYFAVVIEVEGG